MRVCDITKRETVASRIVVLEVPLDTKLDETFVEGTERRVIHDLEVGTSAATAFEKKDWGELNQLTPYDERVKNQARSDGAKKAALTRAANKAQREGTPAQ